MLFEILVILIGIVAGIITGLIPGIHINLIATLLLVNFYIINSFLSVEHIIIFIIAMGITHSYLDFIPSVLFGIPSSDDVLSVLPAHKLALEGKAYYAIILSSIGSLLGTFFAFIISPIFYITLEPLYTISKNYIPYILISIVLIMILMEKGIQKKYYAILIVLFSSSYGMLLLNTSLITNPLLILFTSIFGFASLYLSLQEKSNNFPKQNLWDKPKFKLSHIKATVIGGLCSSICSVTPGIGNAQAATLGTFFVREIESKTFIVITSAINTVGFILSFLTFYLIDKARNGSVFVISQIVEAITVKDMVIYFIIICLVSIISFFLNMKIGKLIIKIVNKLNMWKINLSLLIFLIIIIFYLEKFYGILFCIIGTTIGILCINLNVKRLHLMTSLLVPVIINLF